MFSAAPSLTLAALFLGVWINPEGIVKGIAANLAVLLFLEALVIAHSGLLNSIQPGERAAPLLICGANLGFTLYVCSRANSIWPFLFVLTLYFNRGLGVLLGLAPSGKELAMMRRLGGLSAIYLLTGWFLTWLSPLPHLGFSGHPVFIPAAELWLNEPHKVMAWGFFYYIANGLTALKAHGMKWSED
jgi:hypothetical protein